MFDDVWTPQKSAMLRQAIDDPQMYPFLDVSQINSRNFDEKHWVNQQWIAQQREVHPRPLNNIKIYGSGYKTFGTGGPMASSGSGETSLVARPVRTSTARTPATG